MDHHAYFRDPYGKGNIEEPVATTSPFNPFAMSPSLFADPTTLQKNSYISSKYPKGWKRSNGCFYFTGYIACSQIYGSTPTTALAISRILLDSGASANFISRAAVKKLRFTVETTIPETFTLANGRTTRHDQIVWFKLGIAGVKRWVKAYVDDGTSSHNILFGMEGWHEFRVSGPTFVGTGARERLKVTVCDRDGSLRHNVEVQEDETGFGSQMQFVETKSSVYQQLDRGMAAEEAKAAKKRARV